MAPLYEAYARLGRHPALAQLYPEYLILTHMIIRASIPLLAAGATRARSIGGALGIGLSEYLERHIVEEQGHDEWMLEDLEVLGVDPAIVLSRMPPWSVAAMVGSQYYWTNHHHPVTVLGYITVLEGYPARPEDVDAMIERTGLPAAAFRTLAKHAGLDPGHSRELDDLIDKLPLGRRELSWISVSGLSTIRFAATAFEELFDETALALVPRSVASASGTNSSSHP